MQKKKKKEKKTYVTMSHTLVSNHGPKKQAIYDQNNKNINKNINVKI